MTTSAAAQSAQATSDTSDRIKQIETAFAFLADFIDFSACIGAGLALAGPGLWARMTLERGMGSVLNFSTVPVADASDLVALEITFLFERADGARHIGYGICDAYGQPLPDPLLPADAAQEFIQDYWQRRAFRFPVYWYGDVTTARMYFTDSSSQQLYYQFGIILILCPFISFLPILWLTRRRNAKQPALQSVSPSS